jgi:hypothetical protein
LDKLWYCRRWPEPIRDVFLDAVRELEALDGDEYPLLFGPGHIVWGDENFEEEHVRWCLSLYDPEGWRRSGMPGPSFREFYERYSDHDLAVVRRSLERLLELPKEVWEREPEDED